MPNALFRYFKEGDAAEDRGQTHRAVADEANPYLLRKLDGTDLELAEGVTADEARAKAEEDGETFKFKEVGFKDWYDGLADDTKAKMAKGAEDGTFLDDTVADEGPMVLSLETGEPIDAIEDAPTPEAGASEGGEGDAAPAGEAGSTEAAA